ncbi:hypothetical protein B0T17DRAFT_544348 [Bombardia bombarda]|uniref:Secreted protein n=1 Tax=Bombardia bombarda TaxID=252184 RepID=A0AA39U2F8_9PEZI|nr:hypothetical protein B0T17DRAFT_544348 [Bombardia bombarda]
MADTGHGCLSRSSRFILVLALLVQLFWFTGGRHSGETAFNGCIGRRYERCKLRRARLLRARRRRQEFCVSSSTDSTATFI